MHTPDHEFSPDLLDQQLEQPGTFLSDGGTRLVFDLEEISEQEKSASLDRAWARLAHLRGLPSQETQRMNLQGDAPTFIPSSFNRRSRNRRFSRLFQVLAAFLVVGLLIGSFAALIVWHQAGNNSTTIPIPALTSLPMPATQTSCPAKGTARALITAHLAVGNHATIVYGMNQVNPNGTASSGTLKRYDVSTGRQQVIVQIPHHVIGHAEVSPDGQWILYGRGDSRSDGPAFTMLQAVRVDGQGQQTLYCGEMADAQWSPDQKWIAFQDYAESSANKEGYTTRFQLLNLASGKLETLFVFTTPGPDGRWLYSWLDPTHLSLYTTASDSRPFNLSVLDITKGANQPQSNLTVVLPSFGNVVSSYDRSQLYINTGGCDQIGCPPPSSIRVMPVLGGTQKTLRQSQQLAVTEMCLVNDHQFLLAVENHGYRGCGVPIDNSVDGIWMVNTDGTGLTRPTKDVGLTSSTVFNDCSYTWNNASRDGTMYALYHTTGSNQTGSLIFGKLDGSGSTTSIATGSASLDVSLVGWVMM